MKLHPIMAAGIKAFCSDLIVDPEELDTVYFISACGYQATVKGITANLVENYGISAEIEGTEHYLVRSSLGYKVQVKKLPSGLVHAVLFPKLALPGNDEERENRFFIFTRDTDQRLGLFFRHLDEKVDMPLHPSWARWLWDLFEDQDEWLTELMTLAGNYRGYLFRFNPKELHDLVSTAIRLRVPEVIECMKWKGGESNGLNLVKGFSG
jgi:hypothetical protein